MSEKKDKDLDKILRDLAIMMAERDILSKPEHEDGNGLLESLTGTGMAVVAGDQEYSDANKFVEVKAYYDGKEILSEKCHFTIVCTVNGTDDGIAVALANCGFTNRSDMARAATGMFLSIMDDFGTARLLADSMVTINEQAQKMLRKKMLKERGE